MPNGLNFTTIEIKITDGTGPGYLTFETSEKNSNGFFGANSPKGGFARFDIIKTGEANINFDESKVVQDAYKWACPVPDYNRGGEITNGQMKIFYTCENLIEPDDIKIRVTGDHVVTLQFNIVDDMEDQNFTYNSNIGAVVLSPGDTKGAGYTLPYELSGSFDSSPPPASPKVNINSTNMGQNSYTDFNAMITAITASDTSNHPTTFNGVGLTYFGSRGVNTYQNRRMYPIYDLSSVKGTIDSCDLKMALTNYSTTDGGESDPRNISSSINVYLLPDVKLADVVGTTSGAAKNIAPDIYSKYRTSGSLIGALTPGPQAAPQTLTFSFPKSTIVEMNKKSKNFNIGLVLEHDADGIAPDLGKGIDYRFGSGGNSSPTLTLTTSL